MDFTKKRWTILVVSCIINLCIGTGYAWSMFVGPLAQHLSGSADPAIFGALIPTLTVAFTVSNGIGPIPMILGGKINDSIGPKWSVFVGGLLFGGGVLLTGFATSPTLVIAGYGVMMGLGMGLVYSCTIGNSVKFFPDKRGMVGGLTTATYGLGSVILPYIASGLVSPDSLGIMNTFKMLGCVYIVVICIGAFFIKACPAGFVPDGWTPPAPAAGLKAPKDKDWKQMLADPIFYVMIIMLTCGAFFGLMTISQCKLIATNAVGMEGAIVTTAVAVLALFNAAGRVACGMISDKIGRINTITGALVLALIGLALLLTTGEGDTTKFLIGVCFVGFCFGSFMGVFPGFTADQFGPKNNGVNYGIMFIGFGLAGIFGPMIMANTYASAGTYSTAFTIALVLAVIGLALTFVYRSMSKAKN